MPDSYSHYNPPPQQNSGLKVYIQRQAANPARYWLEQGADGWRLDVPNEIDDDAFWRDFRAVVKGANPEAYIVGEIWHDGPRWLQGDQFDGITQYELRTALLEWLVEGRYRSLAFAHRVQALVERYRPEIVHAQLNMLGSHDTVQTKGS